MSYKKEQIRKALKQYKETQSVTETVRVLGYPSRNALYNWIKQHQESKGRFSDIENSMAY